MSSQDVYGPKYWSVTLYQARLLFFLSPEFERLRDVKNRAEAAGKLSLKKVNWEKLHVLGLLEVDRQRRDWVYVRRGPLWKRFWADLGIDPQDADRAAQETVPKIDAVFDQAAPKAMPLPRPCGASRL